MIDLTYKPIRLCLLLSLIAVGSSGFSQSSTPKSPAGSVSGKVTIRGKAVAGVVVSLAKSGFSPQPPVTYKATTDLEGNYRIAEIPPGSYNIAPIAPVYVASGVNTRTVILGEGEAVEGYDFSLVRGGVITGKVTDADARPLIEERVYLVSVDAGPQSNIGAEPGAMTDDRGVYRMFGIKAGRYRVAVGKSDRNFYDAYNGKKLYPQTFYPDTPDSSKATTVEVGEGTESGNVDIVVGNPIPTFAIRGRAVNSENDQPMPNLRFGLRTVIEGGSGGGGFGGSMSVSNSRGEFKLDTLLPGKYEAFMLPTPDADIFATVTPFEIVDHDLSDVVIKIQRGASISGIVSLEGTSDKDLLARISLLRLSAWVRGEGASTPVSQNASISSEGGFRLGGLPPGTANLGLSFNENPLTKPFLIMRIERDGQAQPQGLPIKAGEQISGVRIVVAYGRATVRGVIKLENGTLPPEARFYVHLEKKPGEASLLLRPIEVDSRGRFLIENLPAGTHELVATAHVPAVRVQVPRVKQQIIVVDGVNDVTIVVDLKANQQPQSP